MLDGTTPRTVVDTTTVPSVTNGFQPPTQDEMAERIIAALDGADGVADSQVLGLTLPSMAAGDVVNGAIVLGGTRPIHLLNTGGPFGVNQTVTPKAADEVSERIANAINAAYQTTALRAAALGNGMLTVLDAAGGIQHTIDITAAPGLTLTGTPGVDPLNIAVPYFPTDTVDEIINGGPNVVVDPPLAAGPPGLITVINTSGLNVSAMQLAFPNDNVIALDGTLVPANTVTFSPGATALRPQDIVPIYVDGKQTPNDVAERIFLAIEDAVRRGQLAATVIPHMNANLGYDDPSIRPSDYRTNRINVEGLKNVTFSSGVASPVVVEGLQGWNDPAVTNQALVPFIPT